MQLEHRLRQEARARAFFGGEGFILEKLTGPGTVFIHAGGDFVEFDLGPGEVLQVDTGCIVGFDDGVDYDIQMVGGIKTAIFGGEGLFLATLRGPGKVVIQSMTLEKMRRELAPSCHLARRRAYGLGRAYQPVRQQRLAEGVDETRLHRLSVRYIVNSRTSFTFN